MASARTVTRAGFIVGLFAWGMIGALYHEAFALPHAINLFTHEVGRLLFTIFGNALLTALGGCILQLAVPIACTIVIFAKHHKYGGAVAMFWIGQNLLEIATAINDARALELSLVGIDGIGDGSGYDWSFLLSVWGVLPYDLAIAKLLVVVGWLSLFMSLSIGLYCLDEHGELSGEDPHRDLLDEDDHRFSP